jgi:hypothetical protein
MFKIPHRLKLEAASLAAWYSESALVANHVPRQGGTASA